MTIGSFRKTIFVLPYTTHLWFITNLYTKSKETSFIVTSKYSGQNRVPKDVWNDRKYETPYLGLNTVVTSSLYFTSHPSVSLVVSSRLEILYRQQVFVEYTHCKGSKTKQTVFFTTTRSLQTHSRPTPFSSLFSTSEESPSSLRKDRIELYGHQYFSVNFRTYTKEGY